MEHPFINDISDKSIEDLQEAITSLNNKLRFAYGNGNSAMIHQIQMVLESYRSQLSKKMDELFSKQKMNTTINIQSESK